MCVLMIFEALRQDTGYAATIETTPKNMLLFHAVK